MIIVLMSTFNRLLGMASKALGGQKDAGSAQRSSGSTDWKQVVRLAADKITGDEQAQRRPQQSYDRRPAAPRHPAQAGSPQHGSAQLSEADRTALARYDYLLRTARPDQLEQVHRDAFARLTPEQRAHVLDRLTQELPEHERPRSADSNELATAATRGEMSRPGLMKRVLGSPGGRGAMAGAGIAAVGGIAATLAGGAVLSAAAGPLLAEAANLGVDFGGLAEGADGLVAGVEGLAGGVEGVAGEALAGGEEYLGGLGDQVGEFGSNFQLPGLDDLFGGR